ncbi:MAG: hypothetical protein MUO76_23405 [Anaerolineaceae bacterium]|nr:hypothetical protein [Anaerolineaceae bacterium]
MTNSLGSIQFEALPKSIAEFISLRDQLAQTPQGGAAVMIAALLAFGEDEELGMQCLTVAVDRERLQEGTGGYKGWELRVRDRRLIESQLRGKAHILRSYIQGTYPDGGYALAVPPYEIAFSANPYSGDVESGKFKVFVDSSGADTTRPVGMRRNNRGVWKALEWSSLLVGVRAGPVDDDL